MVTSLHDLIKELPDKENLIESNKWRFPKLPDLESIDKIIEEAKAGIKTELEALPRPEEQPTLDSDSIEKKLLDYQKFIDGLASRAHSGTYIFLDNIFPIPLRRNELADYMTLSPDEPRYLVKYSHIKAYSQALALWHQLLQAHYNRIFIPPECWNQAIAGKTCLERTERDERRSKFLPKEGLPPINPDLEQYLQEFAGLKSDCGQNSAIFPKPAGNVFYVWTEYQLAYNALVSQVVDLSKKNGLKQKRNGNAHKDDAHADEILVASAAFQTIKEKSPSLIVSNDKDVDRIRQAYLTQFGQDYSNKERLEIGFIGVPKLDD